MKKPTNLKIFYLVETKDLNYSDIEDKSLYGEELYSKMVKVSEYYLPNTDTLLLSVGAALDYLQWKGIFPVVKVITREEYLLYRTMGILK